MTLSPYMDDDNDFVRDTLPEVDGNPGDVTTGVEPAQVTENAGAEDTVDGPNVVPIGDYKGEPGKDTPNLPEGDTHVARGFLALLANLFTPQPVKPVIEGTPELPRDTAAEAVAALEQVKANLRYLGTQAMKVTETPARYVLFPNANVGLAAIQIAGYQPSRKVLTIKNVGTNSVFLGDSQSVSTTIGYELEATDPPLVITAQGEIWAIAAADGERVEMIAEHYV